MMNDSEVKNHKERLRQIEDHLRFSHDSMGVQRDAVGFVEVVHHPTYHLPALNYVTPRRKTALVPGKHVAKGVGELRKYRRAVRVLFIEELFPAFFGESLNKIGLTLQTRFPLYVINIDQPYATPKLPSQLSVHTIENQQGIAIWSLIWLENSYDIYVMSLETLQIEKQHPEPDKTIDVILYHNHIPITVARLTIHNNSAHLMAHAILKSTESLPLHQWLVQSAVAAARQQNCDLLFICDTDMESHLPIANLSCQLEGSVLCYTDSIDDIHGEETHDTMEQPVLLT